MNQSIKWESIFNHYIKREKERRKTDRIHKINYNDDDVNGNTPTTKKSIMDNAYYNIYTIIIIILVKIWMLLQYDIKLIINQKIELENNII